MTRSLTRLLPAAIVLATAVVSFPGTAHAQCKEMVQQCTPKLNPFNYDGDYYRAQLFEDEKATLNITFYSGITYRVVPCGVSSSGQRLEIEVYDKRGVGVFHSRNMPNESVFDFNFGASGQYKIVARYPGGEGCASLVIGYKSS